MVMTVGHHSSQSVPEGWMMLRMLQHWLSGQLQACAQDKRSQDSVTAQHFALAPLGACLDGTTNTEGFA